MKGLIMDDVVVERVTAILREFDLSEIGFSGEFAAPDDEYEPEARDLAALLSVRKVGFADVVAVWLKWFDDDLTRVQVDRDALVAALNGSRSER